MVGEEPSEDTLGALLPGLFAFAAAVTGDRGVAEDVVIEVAARAVPLIRRGRIHDLGVYLRRSVVNEMNNWRRRRQLERRQVQHSNATRSRDASPSEGAVDDRLLLTPLLSGLPIRQRTVLVLRFLEDCSVAEVADLMGVTEGTIKTQTSRGLERLRQMVGER